MAGRGRFQFGNKAAVGRRAATQGGRIDVVTQTLTSILHEIDKETNKAKLYTLCDKLWKIAVGYKFKTKTAKGKTITVTVPPELAGIREIIDRVQGKAPQAVEITNNLNNKLSDMSDEQVKEEARRRGLPESVLSAATTVKSDAGHGTRPTKH